MGITLESKNFSIDMGYGGFRNLRIKVAELTGKEIGDHYKYLEKGMFKFGEEKKMFFEKYDQKISDLADEFKIPRGILDFIYSSDCEGNLTYGRCKQIYKVIENYDDNICYGYCGRKDCATFKDFKQIIKDCIDNKCKMEWS